MAVGFPVTLVNAAGQPDRPFYLMDHRVVQSSRNLHMRINSPQKAGVVMLQEKPWESFYMNGGQLVCQQDEYLLYYHCYVLDPNGKNYIVDCAVRSQDGIHWKRPDVGVVDFQGSVANNIISKSHSGGVSIDPTAPPERRFLMVGFDRRRELGQEGYVQDGIALYASGDGLHWKQLTDVLTPFTCDSANQIFYDPNKQKFVAYLRAFPGRRVVAYYEPPDVFQPWPIKPGQSNAGEIFNSPQGPVRTIYIRDELPIVLDSADPSHQVYNPGVLPLNHFYLAFPDIFHVYSVAWSPEKKRFSESELLQWGNDGLVAPRLYISEDGISFRTVEDKPYIDLGFGDDYDSKMVRMVCGFIDKGDEIWQYYFGHQTSHTLQRGKRLRKASALMRAVQRKDGFVSLTAEGEEGELLTAPVVCTGGSLEVNYDAGAFGLIQVEILDENGGAIPGYTQTDSEPLMANEVYKKVLWSDGKTLEPLVDKKIQLCFAVRQGSLFSFRFR